MYRDSLKTSAGLDARIKVTSSLKSILPISTGNYISAVGGVILAVVLLIPAAWLPGLLIFILPSEVYLIDWVHSRLSINGEQTPREFSYKERSDNTRKFRSRTYGVKPTTAWSLFSQFAR